MADITRDDLSTIIQEEYANVLLDTAEAESASLSAFRTVPLGTKITNAPVLATLPDAYWVSESATEPEGVKPTSKATWGNKRFVVEEIAVIIPIHEDTLEDATEDTMDHIAKLGGTAIGKKLDEAVVFGKQKPATWSDPDLVAAATAAGNVYTASATAGKNDLVGAILQAAEGVADSGADPDSILSATGLRFKLANLRDSSGQPVYTRTLSEAGGVSDSIAGLDARFAKNGSWDNSLARAVIADRDRVLMGVRQDITTKFLDQATVGGINLAERDMVALRFKARYAYVLGNTVTAAGTASKPVGVVKTAAAS